MNRFSILDDKGFLVSIEPFEECPTNGVPELPQCFFVVAKFNFITRQFEEAALWDDVLPVLERKAIEIDLEYTQRISELFTPKMKEQKDIDGIPYPQDVLDERDRLRNECNDLILSLGIKDFTYRQRVPELRNK